MTAASAPLELKNQKNQAQKLNNIRIQNRGKALKSNDIIMITSSADDVEINKWELAQRLGIARDYSNELIEKCTARLKKHIQYKCVYIRTDVDMHEENICDFGFMRIPSRNLYRNLDGCREAFVMAMTAGINVDRELNRLKIISQAEYFVTDGIASAAIDSFADYAVKMMKGDKKCPPRFSPGYGDLSLSFQVPLLERLNAHGLLGITLDSACLMTPMKSITAIMGIKNEKDN